MSREANVDPVILDVREKDEFDAQHIPESIWVPLSDFARLAPGVLQSLVGRRVLLMCRSGNRARLAQGQIGRLGFAGQIESEVYAGGILQWARQGKPLATRKKSHLPILRQVQLAVGLGVLGSVLLSFWVDQRIAWVAAFFGAGLTVAGITGFCGLAHLLAWMPWNKAQPETQEELFQACAKHQRG
jgi:rhodanese-related sulfurtransferase